MHFCLSTRCLDRHEEKMANRKKRTANRIILRDGTKDLATWTREYRTSRHPRIGKLGRIPGHIHNRPKLAAYKSVARITKVSPEIDHLIVYLQVLKKA